jgi:hypothetical protein
MITHLTKAGWSIAARRHMEFVAGAMPVLILLFIPILFFAPTLYWEWWPGAAALKDELIAKKEGWLNHGFFYLRSAIYLVVWSLLGWWFARTSLKQDETGDPQLTTRMQNMSAPMMIVYALTVSFAAFDWLMSLQPHWYSTIFGVYVFSGAFHAALSLLALITLAFHKHGYFKRISTVEHRHDIGKLMFAFTVFWAYIAFSQFFLIWYANIPEETVFYRRRWENGWMPWTMLLTFTQFVFPFLFLLSRHVKRHMTGLAVGAAVILFAHFVDLYFLVQPMRDHHGHFHFDIIADLSGLLAPVGILLFVAARRAAKGPIYPLKDPRLAETVTVENL